MKPILITGMIALLAACGGEPEVITGKWGCTGDKATVAACEAKRDAMSKTTEKTPGKSY